LSHTMPTAIRAFSEKQLKSEKMKKVVRKSMLVLSFLGLFTFVAPKQAKAEAPTFPCTVLIICPDGHCQLVFCEDEEACWEAYALNCKSHQIVVD